MLEHGDWIEFAENGASGCFLWTHR